MAYDIRLVKLVNGDLVIGKFEANAEHITECAALQTVPTQQGMQMMLLPFGYPFEQDFHATHVAIIVEKWKITKKFTIFMSN